METGKVRCRSEKHPQGEVGGSVRLLRIARPRAMQAMGLRLMETYKGHGYS